MFMAKLLSTNMSSCTPSGTLVEHSTHNPKVKSSKPANSTTKGHHSTQYNDIQHDDTKHNDTEHNGRSLLR